MVIANQDRIGGGLFYEVKTYAFQDKLLGVYCGLLAGIKEALSALSFSNGK